MQDLGLIGPTEQATIRQNFRPARRVQVDLHQLAGPRRRQAD
jgi:hypothetical protein